MTIALTHRQTRVAPLTAPAGAAAACAIIVAGTAWRLASPASADIAGLLTVGESMLDGAMPYRDIIEINPPGSVMLYASAVLIGRALGVDAQAVALALAGLACAASLAACAAMLRTIVPPALRGPLLATAAAVLVLLPTGSFGQREHVILLCLLPMLCGLALRSHGTPLPVWASVLAGMAAGIGLAIKPHYGLGLVGPALLVWVSMGWRGLVGAPELWVTAVTAAVAGGAQLLLFPAFTHDVLPLLARVYLPQRRPPLDLVTVPIGATMGALLAGAALRRVLPPAPRPMTILGKALGLAALGLLVAYGVQGKGWSYQAYPALAAGMLALAVSLAQPATAGAATALWAGRAAALMLALAGAVAFDTTRDLDAEAPGLAAAVRQLGPHPRMMSLADDISIGHPLVREVGGVWVGTLMSRWIDQCVGIVSGVRDRQGPYAGELAFEARTMASDIRDRHPDAVLTSTATWTGWIAGEPEVAAALASYRPAIYGSVTLWTPRAGALSLER